MANSFDSNITRKLTRVFLEKFESARVLSKSVNTQMLDGKFNPSSGTVVDFKRPTDYTSKRSTGGDITGVGRSDIVTGKASGTVQDYFTVDLEYNVVDQALKMDQLDELLAPAATRIVTDCELDFAKFMMKNSGLMSGTPGTAASTWDHIADAGAVMQAHGVPSDHPWHYTVNPFTQRNLASNQRSLGAGGVAGGLIKSSIDRATISEMFAGFDKVMTATTLASYTNDAEADRAGTINGAPTPTYAAAKDTMTQVITIAAIGAGAAVVPAGTRLQVAGVFALNLSTREPILDETGAKVLWTGTVTADVTLTGGGGALVVTGPAIFESGGAYNTVETAIGNGDVVTLLGAASAIIQPNLFFHKEAFSIGSVPIPKLYSTDTVATTADGLQIRCSKYADGDANKQIVRFDFQPAYAALNPFFAGHGHG